MKPAAATEPGVVWMSRSTPCSLKNPSCLPANRNVESEPGTGEEYASRSFSCFCAWPARAPTTMAARSRARVSRASRQVIDRPPGCERSRADVTVEPRQRARRDFGQELVVHGEVRPGLEQVELLRSAQPVVEVRGLLDRRE